MRKEGVSHIEVVLSMILFITVLLTLFYFFSPIDESKVASSTLSYAWDSIITSSSTDLVTYSIKVNGTLAAELITFEINNNQIQNFGVHAENVQGNRIEGNRTGNRICVNRSMEEYVTLKFSSGFDENPIYGCPALNESFYAVGFVDKSLLVSERKMLDLNQSYYSDYSSLKSSLNIPGNIDFAFDLVFDNGYEIKADKNVPAGVQAYAKSNRFEVLKTDGGVSIATLIVKAW